MRSSCNGTMVVIEDQKRTSEGGRTSSRTTYIVSVSEAVFVVLPASMLSPGSELSTTEINALR